MSKGEQQEMLPEQAADAAQIEAMVAADEQAADATQQPEQQAAEVPADQALAGLLTVAGMAAGIVGMSRTAAIWSQENCQKVAAAAVPVMVKYPWGQRVIAFLQTGAGVEEIALVMVAGPLVIQTAAAVRADLAEKPASPVTVTGEKPAAPPADFSVSGAVGGDFEVTRANG